MSKGSIDRKYIIAKIQILAAQEILVCATVDII